MNHQYYQAVVTVKTFIQLQQDETRTTTQQQLRVNSAFGT